MILDEPFNGLDMASSRLLMLILEHWRKQGRMIILTSHILESLIGVCDHIHLLKDQHIVSSWEKRDFSLISETVFKDMETEFGQFLRKAAGE